ncbi:MAG TPA: hypothetical protein VI279_11185 [Rhodocyclaceae bacterium]
MLVLQGLSLSPTLLVSALVLLVGALTCRSLLLRLLRRTRWIFLSLIVMFLWMTPGVMLPGLWGSLGLTEEGALAAAEHCARLAAVIGLVALLLDRLDHSRIIAGLYVLMAPLEWLGIQRQRIALRLMLTLDYAADDRVRHWQDWFADHAPESRPGELTLVLPRFQWLDGLVLAALATALAAYGWLAS